MLSWQQKLKHVNHTELLSSSSLRLQTHHEQEVSVRPRRYGGGETRHVSLNLRNEIQGVTKLVSSKTQLLLFENLIHHRKTLMFIMELKHKEIFCVVMEMEMFTERNM